MGGTSDIAPATGNLFMKNGVRYRIVEGLVQWIRDRNGNKISFEYDNESRITKAVDSLNREVTFAYSINAGSPYGICDTITWRGTGGATRTIRISRTNLANVLRSGGLATYQNLFPELSGSNVTFFNPNDKVSALWLPHAPNNHNGRSYKFRYNKYGEIARVELPTGGGFEYDYSGGSSTGPASGVIGYYDQTLAGDGTSPPPRIGIYRRLIERRVLTDIGLQIVEGKTVYDLPIVTGQPQDPELSVVVKNQDAAGNTINGDKHFYYGEPAASVLWDALESQPPWDEGREHETQALKAELVGSNEVLTEVRKVVNDWVQGPLPGGVRVNATTSTLIETNQVSKQTFVYDIYNNILRLEEYDYGIGSPGALLRVSINQYALNQYTGSGYDTVAGDANNPNVAATIHLRSLMTSQAVYSDAATAKKFAETTYEYDNYTPDAGYLHDMLRTRSGISGLCDGSSTNCPNGPDFTLSSGASSRTSRGNVTKISRWLNTTGGTVNTYMQYDVAGNVVKVIDANSNVANIEFDDRFGSPDDDARQNTPPTSPNWLNGQTTYAFPTKVINALGHEAYTQYDYFVGKPVNSEDANGIVSSLAYTDDLDRPTQGIQARYKVGSGVSAERRQTAITYDDPNHIITVAGDRDAFDDKILTGKSYFDGLGRVWRSATYEGNTGSNNTWTVTDAQFDALGRTWKTSNPVRLTTSGATFTGGEWTTTEYDVLNRVIKVITHDTATVKTAYSGNRVMVSDQTGKKRLSETDALGHLVKVWEITSPDPGQVQIAFTGATSSDLNGTYNAYLTSYSYDVLNNLLRVRQGASPTAGSGNVIQTRTFFYDSLSRLLYASNPEQDATIAGPSGTRWTMKYEYDSNGNLTKRTDARNVVTNYSYDALNRNTKVCYSDSTPSVHRFYDSTGFANGKGRLWKVENQTACTSGAATKSRTTVGGYDALGRITSQTQSFATGTAPDWSNYPVSHTYNRAGQVTRTTYPSMRYVDYQYDAAGRLSNVGGTLTTGSQSTYVRNFVYDPAGLMQREEFVTATPLFHAMSYNNRFQMTEVRLGTSSNSGDNNSWNRGKLSFSYGQAATNNGNVIRQEHYVPILNGSGNWTNSVVPMRDDYEYDPLNRLTKVTGKQVENGVESSPIYQQTFVYDAFGNRKINAGQTSGTGINNKVYEPNKRNNRLNGLIYDAAGNVINESYTFRQYDRKYDAENRMTQANAVNSYVYDGDGRRVRRNVNGTETWQVYGIGGELLAEYAAGAATNSPQKEYGYRNGQLLIVAETSPASVKWMVTDHLGTPRIIVDATGGIVNGNGSLSNVSRHDYLPFGEELTAQMAGGGLRTSGNGYAVDTVRQKFTGYEHDNETGLDFAEARYFASTQGRFTSPDPLMMSGRSTNPQSWNRYSYVLNRPLNLIDPSGMMDDDPRNLYDEQNPSPPQLPQPPPIPNMPLTPAPIPPLSPPTTIPATPVPTSIVGIQLQRPTWYENTRIPNNIGVPELLIPNDTYSGLFSVYLYTVLDQNGQVYDGNDLRIVESKGETVANDPILLAGNSIVTDKPVGAYRGQFADIVGYGGRKLSQENSERLVKFLKDLPRGANSTATQAIDFVGPNGQRKTLLENTITRGRDNTGRFYVRVVPGIQK